MIQGELHLFILWEQGQSKKDCILEDIRKNFSLLKTVDVLWQSQYFHCNLSRFYGKKLKKSYKKDKTIGTGPFTVFLVCDKNASEHTVHGKNMKMLDFKGKYRRLLGGNLLHASDSAMEARENLLFLFSQSENELKENYMKLPDFYKQGALAEKAFPTQRSFEKIMSKMPFSVEHIAPNVYRSGHPQVLARLLNAHPKRFWFIKCKNHYKVQIADKTVDLQLI